MASQKNDGRGRIPARVSVAPWEVEICLGAAQVVSERVRARSSREAVEAALTTRRIGSGDLRGVSARPVRDGLHAASAARGRARRFSIAPARLVNAARAA